jgi:hypothetical protein
MCLGDTLVQSQLLHIRGTIIPQSRQFIGYDLKVHEVAFYIQDIVNSRIISTQNQQTSTEKSSNFPLFFNLGLPSILLKQNNDYSINVYIKSLVTNKIVFTTKTQYNLSKNRVQAQPLTIAVDFVGRPQECTLSPLQGPCEAAMTKYYFNLKSNQCEPFIYGNCQGNEFGFNTKQECILKCVY